ncbi:hypothetical protein IFM89_010447 [Coptis chinensis]|uniref:Uncharacterized protein n=1 Tax=Coptis chinensis TaxID=261450 RepID=A0A835LUG4_9MAGN|nr:hypothetical protein IFM89_010447 [Coptis chinensis]
MQSAVASVVSDENVWNAVIQNEKVKEFLKLQKSAGPLSPDVDMVVKDPFKNSESHGDYNYLKNSVDEANTNDSAGFGNVILEIFDKLRLTITEMLKSLCELFENLVSRSAQGGNSLNADRNIGTTIMALGVLALTVVVLKRGETVFAIQHMDQPNVKYVNLFLKTAPLNS